MKINKPPNKQKIFSYFHHVGIYFTIDNFPGIPKQWVIDWINTNIDYEHRDRFLYNVLKNCYENQQTFLRNI